MPETPEQKARRETDRQLTAAGWVVQDRRHLNLHAGPGVALCETDVEGGFADYMLFVDAKSLGVLEAKAGGTPLVGVAEQSELYARAPLTDFQRWAAPLPFTYESNGDECRFGCMYDRKILSHLPACPASAGWRRRKELNTALAAQRRLSPNGILRRPLLPIIPAWPVVLPNCWKPRGAPPPAPSIR